MDDGRQWMDFDDVDEGKSFPERASHIRERLSARVSRPAAARIGPRSVVYEDLEMQSLPQRSSRSRRTRVTREESGYWMVRLVN